MLMCQGVVMSHLDTQKIEFGNNQPKGVSHDLHQNHGAICRIMQIVASECQAIRLQLTVFIPLHHETRQGY